MDDDLPALPSEFPKKGSSGSGSETGYSIEVRYDGGGPPMVVAGTIVDGKWRKLHPEKNTFGVPAGHAYYRHLRERDLLSYPAAQALRWWFHAIAEAEQIGGGLCLESRLVKHQVSYTHSEQLISAHEHIKGDDRSNCIPDWGSKSA